MAKPYVPDFDYQCHALINNRQKKATSYYVTSKQRKELIQLSGDSGALLYAFYVERSATPNYDFEDKRVAETLGWTERKVRRVRQKLASIGWFYQSTYVNRNKRKVVVTFLGYPVVHKFKQTDEPALLVKTDEHVG